MMKRFVGKIKNSFFALFLLLFPLLATGTNGESEGDPIVRTTADLVAIIENIRNWLYTIFLVVAVICFLISAYYFLFTGPDPENLKKAKDTLKYGIYGVVVALLAGGMVALIESILKVRETTQ